MTYEGARGKTASEIISVFNFPQDNNARRIAFNSIYTDLNKKNKKYQLSTANALWTQDKYVFLENYLSMVDKYYGGKATNLDFVSDPENSRIKINNWIADKTNNKIQNLLPSGTITPLTRLILTNAIYFKGLWEKSFDKKNTQNEDFNITPQKIIQVQTMSQQGTFNYAETDKLQILEIPYSGEKLSMLLVLPKNNDLKSVEKIINETSLVKWKNMLETETVKMFIPRFKLETKYFMADDLKSLGMPTAFSKNADFSGMTGSKDLDISQVIHQAFVDVNEEGTEAAAATAVQMQLLTARYGEPEKKEIIKIFRADHPFIFIVQDQTNGNILFLGRVIDPQ